MRNLRYQSGAEIKTGDRIRYHGRPGEVEFVVVEATGDPARDWYLNQFPNGGAMLTTTDFGNVFLDASGLHEAEDLELVARRDDSAP